VVLPIKKVDSYRDHTLRVFGIALVQNTCEIPLLATFVWFCYMPLIKWSAATITDSWDLVGKLSALLSLNTLLYPPPVAYSVRALLQASRKGGQLLRPQFERLDVKLEAPQVLSYCLSEGVFTTVPCFHHFTDLLPVRRCVHYCTMHLLLYWRIAFQKVSSLLYHAFSTLLAYCLSEGVFASVLRFCHFTGMFTVNLFCCVHAQSAIKRSISVFVSTECVSPCRRAQPTTDGAGLLDD
jgi:hypothetical protein